MPFQPAPNIVRVEPIYSFAGQICQNVLHYEMLLPPDASELDALCAAFVDQWTTNLRPLTAAAASLITVRATSLDSEFAPGIEYSADLPLAGTASGTALPNNVTVATRFLTALRGRSFRGRAFHIGIVTGQVTGNEITTSFQTSLRNAWTNMLEIASSPAGNLVVLSRYEGGVLRAEGIGTEVTGIQIDKTLDSQRRRLPGRGA